MFNLGVRNRTVKPTNVNIQGMRASAAASAKGLPFSNNQPLSIQQGSPEHAILLYVSVQGSSVAPQDIGKLVKSPQIAYDLLSKLNKLGLIEHLADNSILVTPTGEEVLMQLNNSLVPSRVSASALPSTRIASRVAGSPIGVQRAVINSYDNDKVRLRTFNARTLGMSDSNTLMEGFRNLFGSEL